MAIRASRHEKKRSSMYYVATGIFAFVLVVVAIAVFRSPSDEAAVVREHEKPLETVKQEAPPSIDTKQETPEELEKEKEIEQEIDRDDNPAKPKDEDDKEIQSEKPKDKLDNTGEPEDDAGIEKAKEDDAGKENPKEDNEQNIEKELDDAEEDDDKTAPSEEVAKQGSDEQEKPKEAGQEEKATEVLPEEVLTANQTELLVENKEAPNATWKSQANESVQEKKSEEQSPSAENSEKKSPQVEVASPPAEQGPKSYDWKLCNFPNAADYIPCLDNKKAIKQLKSTHHFEHRERHCPSADELAKCLVPLPANYQLHVNWPQSRNQVWYNNVPHTGLVSYKKDQNWVRKKDDLLIFPGGGTQFKTGARRYIEFIEIAVPEVAWGKHTRVILDVGCGVASFGGFLFDKDVIAMSFAPKDEHDAQVQLALERGIPAILAVMGTQRLVFPSNSFDAVHCARCRVPWHLDGGKLLLELNRVLRPGGYFLWSAFPVYKKDPEEAGIWRDTTALTESMCWKLVARKTDPRTGVGLAIFQKPTTNSCYEKRSANSPPMCDQADNADAAWYVPMQNCLHKVPVDGARGSTWPQEWSPRLNVTPTWLSSVPKGLFGKPAAEEFQADTEHWYHVIQRSYAQGLEIDWSTIRNVMDMKAGYGGFAAALSSYPVWVMNVVPVDEPDTLPIIYDRGLIGLYHDWCESFSTYPRTYDLLHADHLFSGVSKRCGGVLNTIQEMDRILRPEGWAIFRDTTSMFKEIEPLIKSLHWVIRVSYTQDQEQLVAAQKSLWRPSS